MTISIEDYVNEAPSTNRLGDVGGYFRETEAHAPIDDFRTRIQEVLSYGTPARLDEASFLGRLLAIGLVSASEAYFRSVLSACMELCPICQKSAGERPINLGGVLWHGREGFSRGAFEHSAFSSQEELKKACRAYISFELTNAVFGQLLEDYEKVCQLRHGIVHNDGVLPGRNAVQLEVRRFKKPAITIIRYEQLQDVAAVLDTLVTTFNRRLFAEMCKRWAVDWRRRSDWDPALELRSFERVWHLFECSVEKKDRRGRTKLTRAACLTQVKLEYAL